MTQTLYAHMNKKKKVVEEEKESICVFLLHYYSYEVSTLSKTPYHSFTRNKF
jgi:hypothetical protein